MRIGVTLDGRSALPDEMSQEEWIKLFAPHAAQQRLDKALAAMIKAGYRDDQLRDPLTGEWTKELTGRTGFVSWETPGTEPGPNFEPLPKPQNSTQAHLQYPRAPVLMMGDATAILSQMKSGENFSAPEGTNVLARKDGKFQVDGPTGRHISPNVHEASVRVWREEREAAARRFKNSIPGNPTGKLPGVDVESADPVGDAIGGMLHGGWIKFPGGTHVHRNPGTGGAGDTFQVFSPEGEMVEVPATTKDPAKDAVLEFEGKSVAKPDPSTPHMASGYTDTRTQLHRVSAEVLGLVQYPTNEIALRVDQRDGSFGTPTFTTPDGIETRYSVVNGVQIRSQDGLVTAADPVPGVNNEAAQQIEDVFRLGQQALQTVSAESAAGEDTTDITLWPEHFDLAIEHGLGPYGRANLGVSPGDTNHPEPYFYVGPWSPIEGPKWNGDTFFGAMLPWSEVQDSEDPMATVMDFYRSHLTELRKPGESHGPSEFKPHQGLPQPKPSDAGHVEGKAYDPNQRRDPHTGEWIKVPGGVIQDITGTVQDDYGKQVPFSDEPGPDEMAKLAESAARQRLEGLGITVDPPGPDTQISAGGRAAIYSTVADAVERYPALTDRGKTPKTRPLASVLFATSDTSLARRMAPLLQDDEGNRSMISTATNARWDKSVIIVNDTWDGFQDPIGREGVERNLTAATGSGYEGSTWHEVGHALVDASDPDAPGDTSGAAERLFEKYGITVDEWTGLSYYAALKPGEAMGELSAMYHTPGYVDQLDPELRAKAKRMFDDIGGVK